MTTMRPEYNIDLLCAVVRMGDIKNKSPQGPATICTVTVYNLVPE
jgi:hypothetical protein